MAPKGARAKAKAAAAEAAARNVRKVGRRGLRRTALAALNTLAEEVGAARAQVDPKTASAEDVEFAIRVLDARCAEAPLSTRLRAAVEQWTANGGRLKAELTPPPDLDTPAVLGRHRVLAPEFSLQSRAFMLTYNSRTIRPEMWADYRGFVASLKGRLGARAWAANLEQSLHATLPASGDDLKYHCHAYLIWTDGVGIHRRSLDDFVFHGMRPRVDVCTSQGKHTAANSAALHGLWYCSFKKLGTVEADTNFAPGVFYEPSPKWLEGLYQDKKLTPQQYLQLSATLFPPGHAARKRDVEEVLRELQHGAVEAIVAAEQAALARDAPLHEKYHRRGSKAQ